MSKYSGPSSFIPFDSASFVEDKYLSYVHGEKVDSEWASFFDGLGSDLTKKISEKSDVAVASQAIGTSANLMQTIEKIIDFFRRDGHLFADLNCLEKTRPALPTPEIIGLSKINTELEAKSDWASTIREMLDQLSKSYCSKAGFEYMHLSSSEEREWLSKKIEASSQRKMPAEVSIEILKKLIEAEQFEKFLHSRFVGQKRFSIEGGESAVVAIDKLVHLAIQNEMKDFVLGMAHRGRLNVLVNVLKKPFSAIFSEFGGNLPFPAGFDGDVKYHLGYSSDISENGRNCHLSLSYNPSHLEAINPVVMGRMRAKCDLSGRSGLEMLGILIHGDASFCGQGIVMETLSMQRLNGYSVSGIIHLIINNQIGFTTDPRDSRSTKYCSDPAKGFDIPVFHVNGDSPEDVVFVTNLAFEFRQKFSKDVVIDIVCYRRHGHNEGDDPSPTQPQMYDIISHRPSVVSVYSSTLKNAGVLTDANMASLIDDFKKKLEADFIYAKDHKPDQSQMFAGEWKDFQPPLLTGAAYNSGVKTDITKEEINSFAGILSKIPNAFHERVQKIVHARAELIASGEGLDWGSAEYLAFASLLNDGFNIRLSGQDSGRGTFSHRHAELTNITTGEKYVPLKNASGLRGKFEVINSPLSEYGVLGFEYGYSLNAPNTLTIWEAQFGDFANGAQIVMDQFISASESKWIRATGLVLLLPHAYEGQGPEHSSARLERYLQLCAQDNMQVVNCTTPANYFHILRRQMKRSFRKPLIVMTPKSLLRHKMAVSSTSDFTNSSNFMEVICTKPGKNVKRVILCSGKIYYDIAEQLKDNQEIAIVRLEQIYPFPDTQLSAVMKPFGNVEIIWCQEEPSNMGCFSFVKERIENIVQKKITYIGRKAAASTACGSLYTHKVQQDKIVSECLKSEKIANGSVIEV